MIWRLSVLSALLLIPVVLAAEEDQAGLEEGFTTLFDGKTFANWQGGTDGYEIVDGTLKCKRAGGSGNLLTAKEYGDFHFKFEFKLTPGANNGVGLRAPKEGDPAFVGMEIQILDDTADQYKDKLAEYQYHGSVYGVVPAKRGHLKPVGEWNSEEIILKGQDIKVILNGETIVDANLAEASKNGTIDKREHSGLKRDKGYLCFCGHGAELWFRNLRIKELK